MFLNDDVLNLILSFTQNPECVLVCKKWYNIIIKNSSICSECKKITKIYDYVIWKTDEGDDLCHMSALHKDTYKILDVVVTNILPLKNLFEKISIFAPELPIYMNFIYMGFGEDDSYIIIRAEDENCRFIEENCDKQYFNDFIGKSTEMIANINVLEFYNFINSFNINEIFLFRINNKKQLEIKAQNVMDKYVLIPQNKNPKKSRSRKKIDISEYFVYDCAIEISFDEFKKTYNKFKSDTKYIDIECSTNKITFTSRETNIQSIYNLCIESSCICKNKIISNIRNKEKFSNSEIICGMFKFENLSNIENIGNNGKSNDKIGILIKHNTAVAFVSDYNYINNYGNIIFVA